MKDFDKILKEDPGSEIFVDYARTLIAGGRKNDALNVLVSGLSHNPGHREARLMLARLHYDLNQLPFAVRELEILRGEMPESEAIARLINKLQPGESAPGRPPFKIGRAPESPAPSAPSTLAEADFDLEDLDALDKD